MSEFASGGDRPAHLLVGHGDYRVPRRPGELGWPCAARLLFFLGIRRDVDDTHMVSAELLQRMGNHLQPVVHPRRSRRTAGHGEHLLQLGDQGPPRGVWTAPGDLTDRLSRGHIGLARSAPAPFWVQRREPVVVEVVDHSHARSLRYPASASRSAALTDAATRPTPRSHAAPAQVVYSALRNPL